MELNSSNIGIELHRWFEKSILMLDCIDFDDVGTFDKALNIFIYDYRRYFPNSEVIEQNNLLARHELVGILLYRIARTYFEQANEKVASLYSSLATFLSGFEIYYSAIIGKGLKINHGLGTVIGARVTIGNNALLHQGITLGDKNGGRPAIGDNVAIYAGAKIIGNIKIGNNSIIATNCVCFINIPDNKTVVGIPAKIIN